MAERDRQNLRDVGLALAELVDAGATAPCRAGRLLRGPSLVGLTYEAAGCPKTVINLRACADDLAETAGPWAPDAATLVHCPAENSLEKYNTTQEEVRDWLASALRIFEKPLAVPVLVHCRAGRDRTGIVVAALLLALGVPEDAVVAEFMLSDSASEAHIRLSLAGFAAAGGIEAYFRGAVDLESVRRQLRGGDDVGEVAFLRNEGVRLFRLARAAERCGDERFATHGQRWMVQVEARFAKLATREAGLLAAAGWALKRLGNLQEARAALTEGLRLAAVADTTEAAGGPHTISAGAVKMMRHELAELPGEPEELALGETVRVVGFWKPEEKNGYLSNWYGSPFDLDEIEFGCVEQYLMWSKAQLFKDYASARKILEAAKPGAQKALGRKVVGFVDNPWVAARDEILLTGLRAKFRQNPALAQRLVSTAPSQLAEASPKDTIYGVGLGPDDPRLQNPSEWQGQNVLGKALEIVRAECARS